jgi:hypothetical protein
METIAQPTRHHLREPAVYPTLAMIDTARGPEALPFASDLHAGELETRARALADEYWSEGVWLTGLIAPSQLLAVTDRLEQFRAELRSRVRVFVAAGDAPRVVFLHPGETFPAGTPIA